MDSIISHESDDLSASTRFPSLQYSSSSSAAAANGRQPGGAVHAEHPHPEPYPSCSFQPKPPVFSSSWSPFSPHHGASSLPAVYHPYLPAQHVPSADTRYLRSWLDCAPRGSESVQGQTGQVKLEPQLGHLGGELPAKLSGQHAHDTTAYMLESTSTAARDLNHHPAVIPGAAFEENKDICDGSEDKDGLDQSKLLEQETASWRGRERVREGEIVNAFNAAIKQEQRAGEPKSPPPSTLCLSWSIYPLSCSHRPVASKIRNVPNNSETPASSSLSVICEWSASSAQCLKSHGRGFAQ